MNKMHKKLHHFGIYLGWSLWALWAVLALLSMLISTQNALYIDDNLHWGLALFQGHQFCSGEVPFKDYPIVRGYLDFPLNCLIKITLGNSFWAYALVYQILFLCSQLFIAQAARNFGARGTVCAIACIIYLVTSSHLPYPWPDYLFGLLFSALIYVFSLFPLQGSGRNFALCVLIAVLIFLSILSRVSAAPIVVIVCLVFGLYHFRQFNYVLISFLTLLALGGLFLVVNALVYDVYFSDMLTNFRNVGAQFDSFIGGPMEQIDRFSTTGFLGGLIFLSLASLAGLLFQKYKRIALFSLLASLALFVHIFLAHLPDYFRYQVYVLLCLIGLLSVFTLLWTKIRYGETPLYRQISVVGLIWCLSVINGFVDGMNRGGSGALNLHIDVSIEEAFKTYPEFREFGAFISSSPKLFEHQEMLLKYCESYPLIANFTSDPTISLICSKSLSLIDNTLPENLSLNPIRLVKPPSGYESAKVLAVVPSGQTIPNDFYASFVQEPFVEFIETLELSTDKDPYILAPFSRVDLYSLSF